jgi:hypothetical protein
MIQPQAAPAVLSRGRDGGEPLTASGARPLSAADQLERGAERAFGRVLRGHGAGGSWTSRCVATMGMKPSGAMDGRTGDQTRYTE